MFDFFLYNIYRYSIYVCIIEELCTGKLYHVHTCTHYRDTTVTVYTSYRYIYVGKSIEIMLRLPGLRSIPVTHSTLEDFRLQVIININTISR